MHCAGPCACTAVLRVAVETFLNGNFPSRKPYRGSSDASVAKSSTTAVTALKTSASPKGSRLRKAARRWQRLRRNFSPRSAKKCPDFPACQRGDVFAKFPSPCRILEPVSDRGPSAGGTPHLLGCYYTVHTLSGWRCSGRI